MYTYLLLGPFGTRRSENSPVFSHTDPSAAPIIAPVGRRRIESHLVDDRRRSFVAPFVSRVCSADMSYGRSRRDGAGC